MSNKTKNMMLLRALINGGVEKGSNILKKGERSNESTVSELSNVL